MVYYYPHVEGALLRTREANLRGASSFIVSNLALVSFVRLIISHFMFVMRWWSEEVSSGFHHCGQFYCVVRVVTGEFFFRFTVHLSDGSALYAFFCQPSSK